MQSDIDWHRAIGTISKQIVRIEAGTSYGTGFITHAAHDLRGFATAHHVIAKAEKNRRPIGIRYGPDKIMHVGPGTANEALIVRNNPPDDAALILVKNCAHLPKGVNLIEHGQMVVMGVEIGWLGFPMVASDKLCFFSGRVSHLDAELKQYLVDGVAVKGASGGPAFYFRDNEPVVMGTISSYSYVIEQPDRQPHRVSLPGLSVVNGVSLLTKLNFVEE